MLSSTRPSQSLSAPSGTMPSDVGVPAIAEQTLVSVTSHIHVPVPMQAPRPTVQATAPTTSGSVLQAVLMPPSPGTPASYGVPRGMHIIQLPATSQYWSPPKKSGPGPVQPRRAPGVQPVLPSDTKKGGGGDSVAQS